MVQFHFSSVFFCVCVFLNGFILGNPQPLTGIGGWRWFTWETYPIGNGFQIQSFLQINAQNRKQQTEHQRSSCCGVFTSNIFSGPNNTTSEFLRGGIPWWKSSIFTWESIIYRRYQYNMLIWVTGAFSIIHLRGRFFSARSMSKSNLNIKAKSRFPLLMLGEFDWSLFFSTLFLWLGLQLPKV